MVTIEAGIGPHSRTLRTDLRGAVDDALDAFFTEKAGLSAGTAMEGVVEALRAYVLAGGKRLRPLLCLCGWQAAGGSPRDPAAVRAAASLELFHAFALIHDDIVDNAAVRRGHPSLHVSLALLGRGDHRARNERFGRDSAILVGDLAMVWSDEMLHGSGMTPTQLRAVRPLLDQMRSELMFGQYHDLLSSDTSPDVGTALTIASYKSGRYTVQRPLQIGAALAGADESLLDACTAFALPIGEAFQLRDDLLGIFGDARHTGKSTLDDLREGKGTVLMALALRDADPTQRATLSSLVGDPALDEAGAAQARAVLVATGAAAKVEQMIEERLRQGLAVLDDAPFHPDARDALRDLARAATVRAA
ncbi:polyprenyl synthetase family protein [Micromonospora sp. WMMC241]|uniref:polyprenyl synthetase family protein n=1 Tax=Micromonospora sp. WMMC241 TaxID=3015159 RepID=UPI0022B74618|nr:polyprenyl synthetase family protein [Micromonospora sp. WMMC241]MCZ7440037.1 polyprenyl synthetase family protein [Micromonospora sp. WMMC241]